ncbi:LIM domain only protein 7-like isoform 3-T3 [Polymixia lowei]
MEWREQTSVSCADAFNEARRWVEEVTRKSCGSNDFRTALENGVLLCDLINQLKPGIIKKVNRLSTPIAGLDNVSVFLKACGKLGLKEAQLFHPGDLQDLSTRVTLRREESGRRLKNVLITIFWLGRKAQLDPFYTGPQLNFKAFEGLLGLALSKALEEGSSVCVRDGGCTESWYPEREELRCMTPGYRRGDSVDSVDSLDHSGRTLPPSIEGFGSDTEAEQGIRMAAQPLARRDGGRVPTPLLRRQRGREENGGGRSGPLARACHVQPRPGRPPQVNPGWIWSKSSSDIPMVYPARNLPDGDVFVDVGLEVGRARERKRDQPQKGGTRPKDGEVKWQDDLTKWKNRRRSTNSDLCKKFQEREHVINRMTNGAVTEGGPPRRDHPSPGSDSPAPSSSSTSPASKSSCPGLRPHTRALLARSYASESPYSPTSPYSPHTQGPHSRAMHTSDPNILDEESPSASLASDGAGVTTPSLESPFSSQSQVKNQASPTPLPPTRTSYTAITLLPTTRTNGTAAAVADGSPSFTTSGSAYQDLSSCADPSSHPGPDEQATAGALTDWAHQNQNSLQEAQRGRGQQATGLRRYSSRTMSWSGSASLPRGYRRSEGSSRLSAVITARPFGAKSSRMSSLPRLCSVDDNKSLPLNNERGQSLESSRPTLHRQVATLQIGSRYQASAGQDGGNQEAKETVEAQREGNRSATPFSKMPCQTKGFHYQPYPRTQFLPPPRATLPQSQPTLPQSQPTLPQSQPTLPQTQPTLPQTQSTLPQTQSTLRPQSNLDQPEVHHSDMRVCLSLRPNSRPDFGFETHWDSTGARVKFIQRGSPAELCQLCVGDEIVAVDGIAVAHMSVDQWKSSMTSGLRTGSLTMEIRRYGNNDWSVNGGGHASQPCQSRKTLNLTAAAPMLIGRPEHHANNTVSTETTAMKSVQFNGQPGSGMGSKVIDGEFADKHGSTGSKGGSESAISDLQVPSLSPSSTSWSWDHNEERRRQEKWQEEQERLLQEQYQRDQERLESEWRRAQQDVAGEENRKLVQSSRTVANGVVSPVGAQLPAIAGTNENLDAKQIPAREERKEATSKPQGNERRRHNDNQTERDWAKSKSTPALAGLHKQTRGDQRKRKGQSLSKIEKERQQILEEMKKRTQLLTDNSWIRQRSASMYKEPVNTGVPLRRYESLDNIDTSWRQSPVSSTTFTTASYTRPHSAAGYSAPGRSSSLRYSVGAGPPQRQASGEASSSASPGYFTPGDEPAGQSLPRSCGSLLCPTHVTTMHCFRLRNKQPPQNASSMTAARLTPATLTSGETNDCTM